LVVKDDHTTLDETSCEELLRDNIDLANAFPRLFATSQIHSRTDTRLYKLQLRCMLASSLALLHSSRLLERSHRDIPQFQQPLRIHSSSLLYLTGFSISSCRPNTIFTVQHGSQQRYSSNILPSYESHHFEKLGHHKQQIKKFGKSPLLFVLVCLRSTVAETPGYCSYLFALSVRLILLLRMAPTVDQAALLVQWSP